MMLQSIVLRTQKTPPKNLNPDASELHDGTVAQLGLCTIQYGSVGGTQISLRIIFNSIYLNMQRSCEF